MTKCVIFWCFDVAVFEIKIATSNSLILDCSTLSSRGALRTPSPGYFIVLWFNTFKNEIMGSILIFMSIKIIKPSQIWHNGPLTSFLRIFVHLLWGSAQGTDAAMDWRRQWPWPSWLTGASTGTSLEGRNKLVRGSEKHTKRKIKGKQGHQQWTFSEVDLKSQEMRLNFVVDQVL